MAPLRFNKIWNTALLCAVFLVICDRLLKSVAFHLWQQPHDIISGFSLMFAKNYDIAFSIPTFINPLIIIIPITVVLFYFFVNSIKNKKTEISPALLFIILGAISNLYDRIAYGYIIDYIYIPYFTVFNLADMMICGGILLLIIQNYTLDKKKK